GAALKQAPMLVALVHESPATRQVAERLIDRLRDVGEKRAVFSDSVRCVRDGIAISWKEQTLLNIVKLRYMDTPFFVDLPQITSGYTLQAVGTANAGIFPPVSPLASFAQELGLTLNLQGSYQDRPTISYQPQTGSQFIRNLTQPINPGSVLFLLQSG